MNPPTVAWVRKMRLALFLSALLAATILLPMVPQVSADASDEVLVCCDASPVELYLLGSDSQRKLTPFISELGEESQSIALETSVSSQESLGRWMMPNLWEGEIPSSTWTFSIAYTVENAAGVQINATATVNIGSKSFSAQTEPGSSFLAQGSGSLTFDIEIESLSTTGTSNIELELEAQAIVFSVPGADAKLEFLWGSEEDPSSLEATIPLLDILMLEPEVEGSDVYLAVRLDSPWGLTTLALAESINLRVNGRDVTGDPIETASGDTVRVTWTWSDAAGGVETIGVEVELSFQQDQASLKGSASFEIETFDTGGGTGTYYPPDEPLRTDGAGSFLDVDININLASENGNLKLERVTTITMDDEIAFWMRWGMDHIGDENPALTSMLRAFSAGAVTDEDRVSRFIEPVELSEFERQLVTLGPMYLTEGLGLNSEELVGDFRLFNELKIEVDLNGQNAVINHPVTIRFLTTELITEETLRMDLISKFTVVQPVPLWKSFNLNLEASSSYTTSFSESILRESDAFDFSVSRMPWGDKVTLSGEGIGQSESFSLTSAATQLFIFAPLTLTILTLLGTFGSFFIGLLITRNRKRTYLYLEGVLIPVIGLTLILGYPLEFIGGSILVMSFIWWTTAIASPKLLHGVTRGAIVHPQIPCPACQVMNAVTTDERPHRFACQGCQRTIKLVA